MQFCGKPGYFFFSSVNVSLDRYRMFYIDHCGIMAKSSGKRSLKNCVKSLSIF